MIGTQFVLLIIVLIVLSIMAFIAVRNRIMVRIGLRNFWRHKGHSVICIVGLLVGTSIICGSMVTGDSIEYFIVKGTYEDLGMVDLTVSMEYGQYFNETIYDELSINEEIDGLTDGIAPMIIETVAAEDLNTSLFEPMVSLLGFDAHADRDFGMFTKINGDSTYGDDLEDNETIINEKLAEKFDAKPGDILDIRYSIGGQPNGGQGNILRKQFIIRYIVKDEGKGRFSVSTGSGQMGMGMGVGQISSAVNIFINLDAAQEMFYQEEKINLIKISNNGGIEEGVENSEKVKASVETALTAMQDPIASLLKVETVKQDRLDAAQKINEMISTFLTIFGAFAIIAGVILIINIFTMLAEERKSELGMARAVGMKRKHLMQSFLFEGVSYGLFASALGTGVGLGIGAVLIYAINHFFAIGEFGGIPFHFEVFTLVQAFCLGFIITFSTIFITSWRTSRLNIIRAIRGIEEPKIEWKGVLPIIFSVIIMIIGIWSYISFPEIYLIRFLGPCAAIAGISILIWKWTNSRVAFSVGSLGILAYNLYAVRTFFKDVPYDEVDILFILSGVLIVLSTVLIVMYNSDPIIKAITGTFGRISRLRPTVKTAVSYPLKKKFRTGMTVAMFALVIYMIAMLSVFSNLFIIDADEEFLKQGGGYDIQGMALIPVNDLNNIYVYNEALNQTIKITSLTLKSNVTYFEQIAVGFTPEVNVTGNVTPSEMPEIPVDLPMMKGSMVFGVDDNFTSRNEYEFFKIMEGYNDPKEVWNDIKGNSSKIITSRLTTLTFLGADVGDNITMMTLTGIREFQIVGTLEEVFLPGIFMSKDNLKQYFNVTANSIFLFKLKDGADVDYTAKGIEREFRIVGMNTIIIREVIERGLEMMNSMFLLFEIYLDLGLIVGVAGLGVITIRSVVERKTEIGILRSLGFKRKMIRNAFLMEILFIASLGVIIGMVTGIVVSHELFDIIVAETEETIEFSIPWIKLIETAAIAYIVSILCTIFPARKASKIPPAEALRYVG